ncbi:MAG: hypothetical protein R3F61_22955 [Myxococcota bacterium]
MSVYADDLLPLFLRVRDPAWSTTPGATRAWLQDRLDEAIEVHTLPDRALVVWGPPRGAVQHAVIAADPSDAGALAWLGARLQSLHGLHDGFAARVDGAVGPLLQALLPCGFGPVSVELTGGVREALEALGDRGARLPEGFAIRPLEAADVAQVVAQRRAGFEAHPEHGYPTSPDPTVRARIDASIADTLLDAARADVPTQHVVTQDTRVVGSFGVTPAEGAHGIDLFLVPSARGRGLAWCGYGVLLRTLADHGITRFDGTTASPAVVHVSAVLGRRVHTVILGHRPPFLPLGNLSVPRA